MVESRIERDDLMAENSKIEWTDHTFNPWIGCTKVSPGCANCYAEAQDGRWKYTIDGWGPGKPRKRTSDANWKKPLQWNKQAESFYQCDVCGKREFRKWDDSLPPGGLSCCSNPDCISLPETDAFKVRPRVFCASLSDWLDDEVPVERLIDLLYLIHQTPHLDWLLLTKRPENWRERLALARDKARWDFGYYIDGWLDGHDRKNIWIGTSTEDQKRWDERVPLLMDIPAKVHFVSAEPLLGLVKMTYPLIPDWIIVGGESGPKARPMEADWVRSLRDQSGVSFFFKQWGGANKKAAGRELDGKIWSEFPAIK